jgi:hypothetical protein
MVAVVVLGILLVASERVARDSMVAAVMAYMVDHSGL